MVDLTRDDELHQAIELLFFAYREFTDQPDRILERRGLGRVHHRILYFVGRNPEISVSGLLDILAVSKQALSAPLKQLSGMDLVSLNPDGADRRIKRLTLTVRGKALEAELTGTQMRQMADAFGTAGKAREAGWRTVMEALAGQRSS